MIEKAANSLKKILEPTSKALAGIGAVTLGLMVFMLIISVIMRKAFNENFTGVFELSEFGMVIITFASLTIAYFGHDAMVMDTFVEMMPKKVKKINNVIVFVLDIVILVILAWQLFVYGISKIEGGEVSKLLEIPVWPFAFISGICIIVIALIYLMKLLFEIIGTDRRG